MPSCSSAVCSVFQFRTQPCASFQALRQSWGPASSAFSAPLATGWALSCWGHMDASLFGRVGDCLLSSRFGVGLCHSALRLPPWMTLRAEFHILLLSLVRRLSLLSVSRLSQSAGCSVSLDCVGDQAAQAAYGHSLSSAFCFHRESTLSGIFIAPASRALVASYLLHAFVGASDNFWPTRGSSTLTGPDVAATGSGLACSCHTGCAPHCLGLRESAALWPRERTRLYGTWSTIEDRASSTLHPWLLWLAELASASSRSFFLLQLLALLRLLWFAVPLRAGNAGFNRLIRGHRTLLRGAPVLVLLCVLIPSVQAAPKTSFALRLAPPSQQPVDLLSDSDSPGPSRTGPSVCPAFGADCTVRSPGSPIFSRVRERGWEVPVSVLGFQRLPRYTTVHSACVIDASDLVETAEEACDADFHAQKFCEVVPQPCCFLFRCSPTGCPGCRSACRHMSLSVLILKHGLASGVTFLSLRYLILMLRHPLPTNGFLARRSLWGPRANDCRTRGCTFPLAT